MSRQRSNWTDQINKERTWKGLEWRNVKEERKWEDRVSHRRDFTVKQPAYIDTLR